MQKTKLRHVNLFSFFVPPAKWTRESSFDVFWKYQKEVYFRIPTVIIYILITAAFILNHVARQIMQLLCKHEAGRKRGCL